MLEGYVSSDLWDARTRRRELHNEDPGGCVPIMAIDRLEAQ